MARFDNKVVLVSGGARGQGAAEARLLVAQGAKVVIGDVLDNQGQALAVELGPAASFVRHDVTSEADWARAVEAAEKLGGLHVLVNNAGILRDRMLVNMSEAEWDAVIAVHLKGTFATARHAAAYWRDRSKAGDPVDGRIINTSSPSGLFGNLGQTNYGAAKAGIAAFTVIAAGELGRYGVTVNAIAPTALTRMTEDLPMVAGMAEQAKEQAFQPLAPENISPLVVWLGSSASREITGRVFYVVGGFVAVSEGWVNGPSVDHGARWEPGELGEVIPDLVAKAAANANMLGTR